MRRKKNDEEEMTKYQREALAFMNFEFNAIEDFELLCKVRNIRMDADIERVISFFHEYKFTKYPKSLIELYEASDECKEKYPDVTVATIFDYTVYRFHKYYEVLTEGGFLNHGSEEAG